MKKFVSLMLVALLSLSLCNGAVFAEVTEKTFSAVNDIINETHGDGYYDAGGANKLEIELGKVVLRTGDWICYDISDLEKGTYKMTFDTYCKSTNTLAVEVDDEKAVDSYSFGTGTGSYATLTGLEAGEFSLSGSQQRIKILNPGRAFYFVSFTLKKIDDLSIVSVSGNAMHEGNVFSRGTDSFAIEMNKEIDTSSYEDGDVVIKDALGNVMLSEISIDGKIITINLKETLDYGKEYVIYIKGLQGTGKEQLPDVIEYIFTTDAEDVIGQAYLYVTSLECEEGLITAKGNIKSSVKLQIKGRNADLYIKKADGDSFDFASSAFSDENGEFEISYNIPASFESGEYMVQIKTDYISESDVYEESFLYFAPDFEEQVTDDLSGIENIDDAKTEVDKYIVYTDVDLSDFDDMINDENKVYEKFVGRTFETAQEAFDAIEETVYFECVIQSEDKDDIIAILDDEIKASFFQNFNYTIWSVVSLDAKNNIAEEIIPTDFENTEKLTEKINDLVKQEFITENGLVSPQITATGDEVLTGEIAEVAVSLPSDLDDVYSMHFEISCEEESALLFTDDITVSSDYKVQYEKDTEKQLIKVTVKPIQNETDTFTGELFVLKIPAPGTSGGVHTISLDGYVLYHPDVITDGDTHIDVSFNRVNLAVKVNEITSMIINAQDIIEETEGVGYHDNENVAGERGFEKSGSAVCFREDEWAVYSIYGLVAGEYEIYVNHANKRNTDISFTIDGKSKGTANLALTGSDYSVYNDDLARRIKITGSEKLLKIYFSKEVTFVKTITFKKVEPLKVVLSATSPSVNIGQSAQMIFSLESKQKDVIGAHIELSYDDDESEFFESNPKIILKGNFSDMYAEKTLQNGKIIYDIKFNPENSTSGNVRKVTASGDIFALSFLAQNGTEGTYTPQVSGYLTYLAEEDTEPEEPFVNVPFVLSENPKVTVSSAPKQTGSGGGSFGGGGGKPGGNLYDAPTAAGGALPVVPNENENIAEDDIFTDLSNVLWAKESICALAEKGIVSGRGNGLFAPNDVVTRAEFCKMMVLAFGFTETDEEIEFSDVNSSDWYYDYVKKAKKAGIINGRGDGKFDPNGLITREDMATIACRALNISLELDKENLFADDSEISEYAKNAVYALRDLKIIDGVGDNKYSPKTAVTRAQAAKVIYYMLSNV